MICHSTDKLITNLDMNDDMCGWRAASFELILVVTKWQYLGLYRSQSYNVSHARCIKDSLVKLTAKDSNAVRLCGSISRHLKGNISINYCTQSVSCRRDTYIEISHVHQLQSSNNYYYAFNERSCWKISSRMKPQETPTAIFVIQLSCKVEHEKVKNSVKNKVECSFIKRLDATRSAPNMNRNWLQDKLPYMNRDCLPYMNQWLEYSKNSSRYSMFGCHSVGLPLTDEINIGQTCWLVLWLKYLDITAIKIKLVKVR